MGTCTTNCWVSFAKAQIVLDDLHCRPCKTCIVCVVHAEHGVLEALIGLQDADLNALLPDLLAVDAQGVGPVPFTASEVRGDLLNPRRSTPPSMSLPPDSQVHRPAARLGAPAAHLQHRPRAPRPTDSSRTRSKPQWTVHYGPNPERRRYSGRGQSRPPPRVDASSPAHWLRLHVLPPLAQRRERDSPDRPSPTQGY
jgi:hypothetical protein